MPRVRQTIEVTVLVALLAMQVRAIAWGAWHWPGCWSAACMLFVDWALAAWVSHRIERWASAYAVTPDDLEEPRPLGEVQPEVELAPTRVYKKTDQGWFAEMVNGKRRPLPWRSQPATTTETRRLMDNELGRDPR